LEQSSVAVPKQPRVTLPQGVWLQARTIASFLGMSVPEAIGYALSIQFAEFFRLSEEFRALAHREGDKEGKVKEKTSD